MKRINLQQFKSLAVKRSEIAQGLVGVLLICLAVYRKFQISITVGRVGGEPTYDDITYFLDGRWRLEEFGQSFGLGLHSVIFRPPHAPFLTGLSSLTQLLTGSNSQHIYLVNSIFVVFLLFIIIRIILGKSGNSFLLTGLLASTPIAPMLFYNFRPDIHYALILGIVYALVLKSPSEKTGKLLPVFAVLLFLTKPSFSAYTLANILFCFSILYKHFPSRVNLLKETSIGAVWGLVLLSWYVPRGISEIYTYVISNTIGNQKDFWVSGTPLSSLFSNLQNLIHMLSPQFSLILVIVTLLSLQKLIKTKVHSLTLMILATAIFMNLLISASSRIGNPFFYLTSIIPALMISFYALEVILMNKNWLQWREKSVISVVSFFLLIQFPAVEWAATEIRRAGTVNSEAATLFAEQPQRSVNFMVAGTLNPDTLQWYLDEDRNEARKIGSQALSFVDEASAKQSLGTSMKEYDILITRKFNRTGFPSDGLQELLNEIIKAAPENQWSSIELGDFYLWFKKESP
jgi:hypothetical protein